MPPDPTAPGNASIRLNQFAEQCLEMAGTFRDRETRIVLSHMTEVWLRLAERNVPKQTQPALQQQQQIQPNHDDKE